MTKTQHPPARERGRASAPRVGKWIDDDLLAQRPASGGLHASRTLPADDARDQRRRRPRAVGRPRVHRLLAPRLHDRRGRCDSGRWSTPSRARACVRALRRAARARSTSSGWRIPFPVEVRFAAADDLWLSTAHGRASGYIAVHRTGARTPPSTSRPSSRSCGQLGGRPHWGKMHTLDAATCATRTPGSTTSSRCATGSTPDRMFQNRVPRPRPRWVTAESRETGADLRRTGD